jgi:surface carbohydrate biosynthesis protein (TIGR04326 family)
VSSSSPASRLVVIDDGVAIVPAGRCIAHWSSREPPDGIVSVPALVDATATELRREYIAWTCDLGAMVVSGRTVRAHLSFWPDFSFWWMGLIPEKAPLRSPAIYTVFKLRALERFYIDRGCEGILYVGRDRTLSRTLRNWCGAVGHAYEHVAAGSRRHPRRSIARRFPAPAQALGYLLLKCIAPALRGV